MADMEALKEQLMSMKREGRGFLCVGTDDPEEAAEIMKIAAELSQKEEEEQYEDEEDYEDEERMEPRKTGYVYTYNDEVYDDSGIAELVAENYEEVVIKTYNNDLRLYLRSLDTETIDHLKDYVLKKLDLCGDNTWVQGIGKKSIKKRDY